MKQILLPKLLFRAFVTLLSLLLLSLALLLLLSLLLVVCH